MCEPIGKRKQGDELELNIPRTGVGATLLESDSWLRNWRFCSEIKSLHVNLPLMLWISKPFVHVNLQRFFTKLNKQMPHLITNCINLTAPEHALLSNPTSPMYAFHSNCGVAGCACRQTLALAILDLTDEIHWSLIKWIWYSVYTCMFCAKFGSGQSSQSSYCPAQISGLSFAQQS